MFYSWAALAVFLDLIFRHNNQGVVVTKMTFTPSLSGIGEIMSPRPLKNEYDTKARSAKPIDISMTPINFMFFHQYERSPQ